MKRNFLLSLTFSILSGCGYQPYFFRKTESPVDVSLNDNSFFSTHRYYNDINQEPLEKRLVEIASETKLEDAWIYNTNTRRLLDIGINEQSDQVQVLFLKPRLFLGSRGDKLIHYHVHPLNALSFIGRQHEWKCDETFRYILAKLNSSNSVLAVPSGNDLVTCLEFDRVYSTYGIDTKCKIADYQGVLSFTINSRQFYITSRRKEDLLVLGNILEMQYYTFKFTFDEYKSHMAQLGVKIDYQRYFNKLITEPTWCNTN